MLDNALPGPRMLMRQVHDHVELMRHGKTKACIVTPSAKPWREAAERLASQLDALVGMQPEIMDAAIAFDRDHLSLSTTCRNRPIIFIGHAGVNPAMLELYARRLFVVDDSKPGCATVQTYGNPWGNGHGVALVGASSSEQINEAADLFLKHCKSHLHQNSLSLPRIFVPGPDPLVHAANRQHWQRLLGPQAEPWCAPLLEAAIAHLGYEEARALHEFTAIMDIGVFDDQQVNDLEQAMLLAVLQMPAKVWWYPGPDSRNGRIGGRHENFKIPRLLLLVRHLLEVGRPDEVAHQRLEEIRKPLEYYLDDVLTCAYRNDHEGAEATTGWEAMVWAALATGKSCYFTSGKASKAAFNAFLETDNQGSSASHCQFGGVGNLFQSSELQLILGVAAWWDSDGRYLWLLQNLPFETQNSYSYPMKLGMECVTPRRPSDWLGMQWQPISEHSYDSSLTDKRWRQPGMEREKTFDVLAFRSGFATSDQYLAIDGFQNHFQPLGLGAILRYVDLGKLFLVAHTGAEGNYYKSGLAVSRGVVEECSSADVSEPWGAELTMAVDGSNVAMSSLRCADYHGVDWTRHVIWHKGRYFLLIDHVVTREPGLYTLTATWRTGFPAEMEGDNWVQHQVPVTFQLKPSKPMAGSAGKEPEHLYPNEIVPYVLRQHAVLKAEHAGDQTSVANLIYASSPECPRSYEIASLTENTVVIHTSEHTALTGHSSYVDEDMVLRASIFYISEESAMLADPSEFWLYGRNILMDQPAGDVEIKWSTLEQKAIRKLLLRLRKKAHENRTADAAIEDLTISSSPKFLWAIEPFTEHHQQIDVVVDKDSDASKHGRWSADLNLEHELHAIIVECNTEKLVGGEGWPEFNTQPAHFEPVLLEHSVAHASRLNMLDDLGTERVSQGSLIHQYVGPYGKSSYANQACIQFSGAKARRVEVELPQGTSIRNVRVYSKLLEPAQVVELQACVGEDKDGQGEQTNLICRTADDQLAFISPTGKLLWQQSFDRKILAVAPLMLSLLGEREIVVSDAGANLWRLSQDGRVLERTVLSTSQDSRGDFFNQGHTQNRPYSLGTWIPAGETEPAIFMGTYQSMAWRNVAGKITCWPEVAGGQSGRTGIAWRGLIYWDRVLRDAVDLDGDGIDDQVVFGRGFATNPAVTFISGRTHEVFAEHIFPNGWTLGLERAKLAGRHVIIAANEFQLGIFSHDGKVIRTLRFDTPAVGYALSDDRIYVAKCDGMLLSFDGQGKVVTKTTLPGPLHGIAAGRTIIVTGQSGLHLMTRDLEEIDKVAMQCTQLLRLGDGKLAAATSTGKVVLLQID